MVKAKLIEQKQIHQNLYEHTVLVQGGRPFKAGQYQSFSYDSKKFGPFSLLSTPEDLPYIKYLSRQPWQIKNDEILTLGDPQGQMLAEDLGKTMCEHKNITPILIAGGTGIVPFISLLNWFKNTRFELFWSYKNKEDLLIEDLYLLKNQSVINATFFDNLDQHLDVFLSTIPVDKDRTYYLAGPYPFVDEIATFLQAHGVVRILSDMKKFDL